MVTRRRAHKVNAGYNCGYEDTLVIGRESLPLFRLSQRPLHSMADYDDGCFDNILYTLYPFARLPIYSFPHPSVIHVLCMATKSSMSACAFLTVCCRSPNRMNSGFGSIASPAGAKWNA